LHCFCKYFASYGKNKLPIGLSHLIAEGSGHLIPLVKPEVVVDAIQLVIADVNKKAAHLAGGPPE